VQCLELDFRKPTTQQIASRMSVVCQRDGLAINDASLRTLIEGAQGDVRLVLGQLQVRSGARAARSQQARHAHAHGACGVCSTASRAVRQLRHS
jgi:DNA polymerase III delta prime subunit